MFFNTDESFACDFLHEKMRSNVFILICFVIVIGCEPVYRPGALQRTSGPCEPETRKGKEDACFLRSPHFLSNLYVGGRFLVFSLLWFVDSAPRKLNRGRKRKRWGEGGGWDKGRRQWGKPPANLQTTPKIGRSKRYSWLADRMSTSAYKLQRNTVGCNTAHLICVLSKKSQYFDQYLARQVLHF